MFWIFKKNKVALKPEIRPEESAQEYNKKLDAYLFQTGIVDFEIFSRFNDAYGYNAASTIGWLNSKLNILRNRLSQRKPLSIYNPNLKRQFQISSSKDFNAWVNENFPKI